MKSYIPYGSLIVLIILILSFGVSTAVDPQGDIYYYDRLNSGSSFYNELEEDYPMDYDIFSDAYYNLSSGLVHYFIDVDIFSGRVSLDSVSPTIFINRVAYDQIKLNQLTFNNYTFTGENNKRYRLVLEFVEELTIELVDTINIDVRLDIGANFSDPYYNYITFYDHAKIDVARYNLFQIISLTSFLLFITLSIVSISSYKHQEILVTYQSILLVFYMLVSLLVINMNSHEGYQTLVFVPLLLVFIPGIIDLRSTKYLLSTLQTRLQYPDTKYPEEPDYQRIGTPAIRKMMRNNLVGLLMKKGIILLLLLFIIAVFIHEQTFLTMNSVVLVGYLSTRQIENIIPRDPN